MIRIWGFSQVMCQTLNYSDFYMSFHIQLVTLPLNGIKFTYLHGLVWLKLTSNSYQ
jgi:hypothetical protein